MGEGGGRKRVSVGRVRGARLGSGCAKVGRGDAGTDRVWYSCAEVTQGGIRTVSLSGYFSWSSPRTESLR